MPLGPSSPSEDSGRNREKERQRTLQNGISNTGSQESDGRGAGYAPDVDPVQDTPDVIRSLISVSDYPYQENGLAKYRLRINDPNNDLVRVERGVRLLGTAVVQYGENRDGPWDDAYDGSQSYARVSSDYFRSQNVGVLDGSVGRGVFRSVRFIRSAERPTVANASYNPDTTDHTWKQTPPSGSDPLWVIQGVLDTSSTSVVEDWTSPLEVGPYNWTEISETKEDEYIISKEFTDDTPKFEIHWRVTHQPDSSVKRGSHVFDSNATPEFESELALQGQDARLSLDGDEDTVAYRVQAKRGIVGFPDPANGEIIQGRQFTGVDAINLGYLEPGQTIKVAVRAYRNLSGGTPEGPGETKRLSLSTSQDRAVPQVRFGPTKTGKFYRDYDSAYGYMQVSFDRGLTWEEAVDIEQESASEGTTSSYYFARAFGAPEIDPFGDNPGTAWSDTPPSGSSTLWVTSGPVGTDGTLAGGRWETPYPVVAEVPPKTLPPTEAAAQFSDTDADPSNSAEWEEDYDPDLNHEYIRLSWDQGTSWQSVHMETPPENPQRSNGKTITRNPVNRFTRSATQPDVTDRTTYNGPDFTKWTDLPPTGSEDLWFISALADLDNDTLVAGDWSAPIRLRNLSDPGNLIEFARSAEGPWIPTFEEETTHFHLSLSNTVSWTGADQISDAYFQKSTSQPSAPVSPSSNSDWKETPDFSNAGSNQGEGITETPTWLTRPDGIGGWTDPMKVRRDLSPRGPQSDEVTIQYSADKVSWHDEFREGDVWLRQRVGNGVWQGPTRIVGEGGQDGVYLAYYFQANNSPDTAPDINSTDDPSKDRGSGWVDGPGQALSNGGKFVWAITAEFLVDQSQTEDIRQTDWDGPFRINGEDAIQYFIRPTDGRAIKNSNPDKTLGLEVIEITGESQALISSGDPKIYVEDGSGGYEAVSTAFGNVTSDHQPGLTSQEIQGNLTLYLRDGDGNVLDTVTLADLTDGVSAGYVQSPDGLSVVHYSGRDTDAVKPTSLPLVGTFVDSDGTEHKQQVTVTPSENTNKKLEVSWSAATSSDSDPASSQVSFTVTSGGSSATSPVVNPREIVFGFTGTDENTGEKTVFSEQVQFTKDDGIYRIKSLDGATLREGGNQLRFEVTRIDGEGTSTVGLTSSGFKLVLRPGGSATEFTGSPATIQDSDLNTGPQTLQLQDGSGNVLDSITVVKAALGVSSLSATQDQITENGSQVGKLEFEVVDRYKDSVDTITTRKASGRNLDSEDNFGSDITENESSPYVEKVNLENKRNSFIEVKVTFTDSQPTLRRVFSFDHDKRPEADYFVPKGTSKPFLAVPESGPNGLEYEQYPAVQYYASARGDEDVESFRVVFIHAEGTTNEEKFVKEYNSQVLSEVPLHPRPDLLDPNGFILSGNTIRETLDSDEQLNDYTARVKVEAYSDWDSNANNGNGGVAGKKDPQAFDQQIGIESGIFPTFDPEIKRFDANPVNRGGGSTLVFVGVGDDADGFQLNWKTFDKDGNLLNTYSDKDGDPSKVQDPGTLQYSSPSPPGPDATDSNGNNIGPGYGWIEVTPVGSPSWTTENIKGDSQRISIGPPEAYNTFFSVTGGSSSTTAVGTDTSKSGPLDVEVTTDDGGQKYNVNAPQSIGTGASPDFAGLTLNGGSKTADKISDDTSLSDSSSTSLPTENAVKNYVDALGSRLGQQIALAEARLDTEIQIVRAASYKLDEVKVNRSREVRVQGTQNQISTSGRDGTLTEDINLTLSLPQDIDTAADTTFNSVTLGSQTSNADEAVRADRKVNVEGTQNQVSVDGRDGTLTEDIDLTLSLPQDIDTAADTEFNSVTLGSQASSTDEAVRADRTVEVFGKSNRVLVESSSTTQGDLTDEVSVQLDAPQNLHTNAEFEVNTLSVDTTAVPSDGQIALASQADEVNEAVRADRSILGGQGIQDAGDLTSDATVEVDSTVARTDRDEVFNQDVKVVGSFTVEGEETIVNTTTLEAEDNLLFLNAGDTGAGVTKGQVGFEADRGTLPPINLIFDESDDLGRVGVKYRTLSYSGASGSFTVNETVTGSSSGAEGVVWADTGSKLRIKGRTGAFDPANDTLEGQSSGTTASLDSVSTMDMTQAIATREDTPAEGGIPYYNPRGGDMGRYDTTGALTYQGAGSNDKHSGEEVQISAGIGHPKYAAEAKHWYITPGGLGDFRTLLADELRVEAFIAEVEEALAGSDFLTKSFGTLDEPFDVPSSGAVGTQKDLTVQDLDGLGATPVFGNNTDEQDDTLRLRIVDRSGDGLTVADIWLRCIAGSYTDNGDGTQTWTVEILQAGDGGIGAGLTAPTGSVVLDYGVPGDFLIERSVLDPDAGDIAPYDRMLKWRDTTGDRIPDEFDVLNLRGRLDGLPKAYASGFGTYTETGRFTSDVAIGDLEAADQDSDTGSYFRYTESGGIKIVNSDGYQGAGDNSYSGAILQLEEDVRLLAKNITQEKESRAGLELKANENSANIKLNAEVIGDDSQLTKSTLSLQASQNETDVGENATSIASLETTLSDNGIDGSSNLEQRVSTNETDVGENATSISTLETTLSDNGITGSTNLTQRVSTTETDVGENATSISSLETTLSDNGIDGSSNLEQRVSTNETDVGTNATSISELETTLSDNGITASSTLTQRVSTVETNTGENTTSISELTTTLSSNGIDSSTNITQRVSEAESNINLVARRLTQERESRAGLELKANETEARFQADVTFEDASAGISLVANEEGSTGRLTADSIIIDGDTMFFPTTSGDGIPGKALVDDYTTESNVTIYKSGNPNDKTDLKRPGGGDLQNGDIYLDTSNGNRPWVYDTSADPPWVQQYTSINGGNIDTGTISLERIDFTLENGRIKGENLIIDSNVDFQSPEIPGGALSDDYTVEGSESQTVRKDGPNGPGNDYFDGRGRKVGDVWIDTADGDRPHTWTGNKWKQAYTNIRGGEIDTDTITLDNLNFTEDGGGGKIKADALAITASDLDIDASDVDLTAGDLDIDASDVDLTVSDLDIDASDIDISGASKSDVKNTVLQLEDDVRLLAENITKERESRASLELKANKTESRFQADVTFEGEAASLTLVANEDGSSATLAGENITLDGDTKVEGELDLNKNAVVGGTLRDPGNVSSINLSNGSFSFGNGAFDYNQQGNKNAIIGGWFIGTSTLNSVPVSGANGNDINEISLFGQDGTIKIQDPENPSNVLSIGNIGFAGSVANVVDNWYSPSESSNCEVETDRCIQRDGLDGSPNCGSPPYTASCDDPASGYNKRIEDYIDGKSNTEYKISYNINTSTSTNEAPTGNSSASASADAYVEIKLLDGSGDEIRSKRANGGTGTLKIGGNDNGVDEVRVVAATRASASASDFTEGYFASSASASASADTGQLQELGDAGEFISSKGISYNQGNTANKRVGIKREAEDGLAEGGAILVGEWELIVDGNDLVASHPSGTSKTLATEN